MQKNKFIANFFNGENQLLFPHYYTTHSGHTWPTPAPGPCPVIQNICKTPSPLKYECCWQKLSVGRRIFLFLVSLSSPFSVFSSRKPTLGRQSQQTDHQSRMSVLGQRFQAVACEGKSPSLEPGLVGSIGRAAGPAQIDSELLISSLDHSKRLSHCEEHG